MIDNLPFVCTDYRKYKHSFLNQAMVALSFDAVEADDNKEKAWRDYVRATFGANSEKSVFEVPVVLSSNESLLSFMFSNNQVAVRMGGNGYKNFADTVVPQVYKMRQFIEKVIGSDAKITKARIFKVNLWQVECPTDIMQVSSDIRQKLFSKAYNSYEETENDSASNISPMIDGKNNVWKNEDEVFSIHTGWVKVKDKKNLYRMLFHSEYEVNFRSALALNEVDSQLGDMNYILFNAFEWTVSDMVKQIMNNE